MHDDSPVHATSHAHDPWHLVFAWHDDAPLHVTSQSPGPQSTSFAHDMSPVHRMSHALACVQSTWPLHALSPHTTRHGRLFGQWTSIGQLPSALQSITQTSPSQVP